MDISFISHTFIIPNRCHFSCECHISYFLALLILREDECNPRSLSCWWFSPVFPFSRKFCIFPPSYALPTSNFREVVVGIVIICIDSFRKLCLVNLEAARSNRTQKGSKREKWQTGVSVRNMKIMFS